MEFMLTSLLENESLRVIDIGARGENTLSFLDLVSSKVELIGFEPDKDSCDELNKRKSKYKSYHVYPYAIGRSEDDRDFYVTQLGDLSSLLKPSMDTRSREPFQIKKVVKVSTVPLDVLAERGELKGRYDLVKLDTQGSELEILKSGENLLKDVICVLCETEFFEMYEGQPRFSDVESYLRSHGFILLSINQHSAWSARHGFEYSKRRVTWADTIFIKSDAYFQSLPDELLNTQVRKLIFLLSNFGYFGEAMRYARSFLPEASSTISSFYGELHANSLIWRAKLFFRLLTCLIYPSRKNRILLAKKALEIKGHHQLFYVSEVGKI